MATKPKAETTAVANWEAEMEEQARAAAAQEANTGGGSFFSTRAGVLAFGGQAMPNNEIAVLVVDGILENVWYPGDYNADEMTPPACFAFGRDEADLAPHLTVVQNGTAQSKLCKGCEKNEWGSAEKGAGKACGNRRRLALITAGKLDEKTGAFTPILDPDHYTNSPVGYMKIPPTSIAGYANFVKQLAAGARRPPHGVFTKVKVRPHPKKQFEVSFEPLMECPGEVMGAIMARHTQEMSLIEFPYQLGDGSAQKKPAVKTTGKKYTR